MVSERGSRRKYGCAATQECCALHVKAACAESLDLRSLGLMGQGTEPPSLREVASALADDGRSPRLPAWDSLSRYRDSSLKEGASGIRVAGRPYSPRDPFSEIKGYACPRRFFGESARGSFFSEKAALSHHPRFSAKILSIAASRAPSWLSWPDLMRYSVSRQISTARRTWPPL